jgi:toxin CptA
MTSAPAIGFEYRPSRWLPRVLAILLLLVLAAIALCGLSAWARLGLALLTLALVGRGVRLASRHTAVMASWAPDGGWNTQWADGSDGPARLESSRVLGAWILLRLRAADGRRAVLLLTPDNSDADLRRRLRMRLAVPAEPSDRR